MRTFMENFDNVVSYAWDKRVSAVRDFLLVVLNTPRGSRPYYPEFGCDIEKYKYMPLNTNVINMIHHEIRKSIDSISGLTLRSSSYRVLSKERTLLFQFVLLMKSETVTVKLSYKEGVIT